MTEPLNQLPTGLEEDLGNEQPSDLDEITDLKNRLDLAEGALEDLRLENDVLEAKVKVLSEELPIKQSAFRFARVYLILIPLLALILVVLSSNDGLSIKLFKCQFEFNWKLSLEGYTQSALVIGPIIFVATVLGFLVKAVFSARPDASASNETSILQVLSQIASSSRN